MKYVISEVLEENADGIKLRRFGDKAKLVRFIEKYIKILKEDSEKQGMNSFALKLNPKTKRFSASKDRPDLILGNNGDAFYFCNYCKRTIVDLYSHAEEHFLNDNWASFFSGDEIFKLDRKQDLNYNLERLKARFSYLDDFIDGSYDHEWSDPNVQEDVSVWLEFRVSKPYPSILNDFRTAEGGLYAYPLDDSLKENGEYVLQIKPFEKLSPAKLKEMLKSWNQIWDRMVELERLKS